MAKYSLRLPSGSELPLKATDWKQAWSEAETRLLAQALGGKPTREYKGEVLKNGLSIGAFSIEVPPALSRPNPARRPVHQELAVIARRLIVDRQGDVVGSDSPVIIKVANLKEASRAVRDYIERRGMGSSEWAGGEVLHAGSVIARVSYNGRVWAPDGKEITDLTKPLPRSNPESFDDMLPGVADTRDHATIERTYAGNPRAR